MSVLQSFENTYGGKRAKKNKVGVNVGNVKCSLSWLGSFSSASFSEGSSNPLNDIE